MADEHHDDHGGGHGGGHGGAHGGGHGGGHEEGHEGAPEWLISFADNVALMMGFFVVLLAMNMKPTGAAASTESGAAHEINGISVDMLDWALAVREAFNNPVSVHSTDPAEAEMVTRLRQQRGLDPDLPAGGGNGEQSAGNDPGVPGKFDKSESIRPADYHTLGGVVHFERGEAALTEEADQRLRKIALHIRGLRTMVDVRAHCSAAEVYQAADAGMPLAFARAQAVARTLAELGVEWKRLRLTAVANNERIVENEYSDDSKRDQQRVEIVCTNEASEP